MNQPAHNRQHELTPVSPGRVNVMTLAALIAAAAVVAMLGVRPVTSEDLGCHVTYGRAFWNDGRIVDHDPSLYTLPSPHTPPQERPALMAGGWYDDQGRCRFPNANWMTQVVFGGVYMLGGLTGLNVLLMVMVWGFFALSALLMWRLGVGRMGIAFGLLLIGLISFTRFTLRPELPGYMLLLSQAAFLAPLLRDVTASRVRPGRLVGLIVLQGLLVNIHSYFYIGLGLTGAVAAEAAVKWVWADLVDKRDDADSAVLAHNALWLGILLVVQLAVCLVNPWTWRLVLLPIQTYHYLREHQVASGAGSSPWAILAETQRTFMHRYEFTHAWESFLTRGFRGDWVRAFYILALLVAVIGGTGAAARRRWGQAIWVAAGVYLSWSMVRNVAIGTLLMLPVGLAVCHRGLDAARDYVTAKTRRLATVVASTVLIAAGAFLGGWIATDQIYQPQFQLRFGMGVSGVMFPLGPAKWINEHQPTGRIWTDFITSSNLALLLDPPRPLPIITNGWAYPPAVMQETVDVYSDTSLRKLDAVVRKYNVTTLLIRTDRGMPIWSKLADHADWTLVYLDGAHAIFLRKSGSAADAELARREQIRSATWDAEAYIARAEREEPRPSYALEAVGASISAWRWDDQAVRVLRESVALDPRWHVAWRSLGLALYNRGLHHQQAGRDGAEDYRESAKALRRSLDLQWDPRVAEALRQAESRINPTPFVLGLP